MGALKEIQLNSVSAPVEFMVRTGVTPVALVKEAGQGPDERTGTTEEREVVIHDARPIADQLDLDRQGFELRHYETAVQDFYDDDEVRRIYYPEMEKLIIKVTGAEKVVVFDHTIRVEDEKKQVALKVRAPVRSMHNDFTIRSAPQRVRDLLPAEEAEARLNKRYGSINVWRPIKSPVENKPLAICDYDGISDGDLIAAERQYPDGRFGGIYHLAYNPRQRWYYFPRMERDEVVLLKCFDSLTDGTARWTAHGTFDDPNRPPDAKRRESIEIRTLLFFD